MQAGPPAEGEGATAAAAGQLVVVRNVPPQLRSADLRVFFARAVEDADFACFHYRHRPEVVRTEAGQASGGAGAHASCCCVVRIQPGAWTQLHKEYEGMPWYGRDRVLLSHHVHLALVSSESARAATQDSDAGALFSTAELARLPELFPPALMPQGNVGTPTCTFHRLIQECKLPPSIVKKLGLVFPRNRKRKYGAVPFEYADRGGRRHKPRTESRAGAAAWVPLQSPAVAQATPKGAHAAAPTAPPHGPQASDGFDVEDPVSPAPEAVASLDDEDAEEWERHVALHEHDGSVDPHNRAKERLFEEDVTLTWEKGGSGLVFYTDSFYWDQMRGKDFDDRTADDWDVDTGIYYGYPDPDRGARDLAQMRAEGSLVPDAFDLGRQHDPDATLEPVPGAFERYTKGVGSRILKAQGWRQGQGLGRTTSGMADALEAEGQPHNAHYGLGYRGPKLQGRRT